MACIIICRQFYRNHLLKRGLLQALLCCVLLSGVRGYAQQEYTIPADPPGMNRDEIVATVGDITITLGEFRARVRYERWRLLLPLARLVEEYGVDVLDVSRPENPFVVIVQNTTRLLSTPLELGRFVYDRMVLEALYRHELRARGLEIADCTTNALWQEVLWLRVLPSCQTPAGLDAAIDGYIAQAAVYSGMSGEAIAQTVLDSAAFGIVQDALAAELVSSDPIPLVRTRHIRVTSRAAADVVMTRIASGEAFYDVLLDTTEDPNAAGTDGDLGYFTADQTLPRFAEAVFGAQVGDIVGPVRTAAGFHVVEVLDRTGAAQFDQMILPTEAQAAQLLARLQAGEDFAALAAREGLIVTSYLPANIEITALKTAIYSADVGEIVGPIQTEAGYHLVLIRGFNPDIVVMRARHILLRTEGQAYAVLQRLQAGEDFVTLVHELSLDIVTAGHGGDTLLLATGGEDRGYYTQSRMIPEIADPAFAAQVGDILGPIEIQGNYFIVEVLDRQFRPPTLEEMQRARSDAILQWQNAQVLGAEVVLTTAWLPYVPEDPRPSDVSPLLTALEERLPR